MPNDPFVIRLENVGKVADALTRQGRTFLKGAAIGLNRTAEEINAAIWGNLSRSVTIREPRIRNFVAPRTLPSKKRATAERPRVVLETEGYGQVLNPLEEGLPHKRDRLGRQVAIPSTGADGLRPTERTVIPRGLYPVNLGLQPRLDPGGSIYYAWGKGKHRKKIAPKSIRQKKTGRVLLVGKKGTYQIGNVIYQRQGRGPGRPIWYLRDQVSRPRVLHFKEISQAIADRRLVVNIEGGFAVARERGW